MAEALIQTIAAKQKHIARTSTQLQHFQNQRLPPAQRTGQRPRCRVGLRLLQGQALRVHQLLLQGMVSR